MSGKLKAHYVGSGFLHGIPARDLSETDWANLNDEQKQAITNSPAYEIVTAKKKAEPKKEGE